jgi:hypothetical protein
MQLRGSVRAASHRVIPWAEDELPPVTRWPGSQAPRTTLKQNEALAEEAADRARKTYGIGFLWAVTTQINAFQQYLLAS